MSVLHKLMELLKKKTFEKYQLSHENRELIRTKRPDFAFFLKNKPHPLYAPFVVELQVGNFDNEHKAKVIRYNLSILEVHTHRKFIISVLTNLENMLFIKTERCENYFSHFISVNTKFWYDGTSKICGLHYIQQMLDEPHIVGFDEKLNFCVDIDNR